MDKEGAVSNRVKGGYDFLFQMSMFVISLVNIIMILEENSVIIVDINEALNPLIQTITEALTNLTSRIECVSGEKENREQFFEINIKIKHLHPINLKTTPHNIIMLG